jgi:uncharacterized SAM-binding protein YcdF (DUF218 family)
MLLLGAGCVAKKFRAVFFIAAFTLYGLSTSFLSAFLLAPLESPFRHTNTPPKLPLDAVVVLGGGVIAGQSIPLSSDALKRAMSGVSIAKTLDMPLIYTGGGARQMSEAEGFLASVAQLYNPFGITFSTQSASGFHVILEHASRNTDENAKLTRAFFDTTSPRILLVTSAYHMHRAIVLFEHYGFTVTPFATDFKQEVPFSWTWRDALPSFGALSQSYRALHEYAGLLSLLPRGIWRPF